MNIYPEGYQLDIEAVVESLYEHKFRNNDDYTRIDDVVAWQIHTFTDWDYIWGANVTLAVRPNMTNEFCMNSYLDDLFLVRHPGFYVEEGVTYSGGPDDIRSKWWQEPIRFFDSGADRRRERDHQYVDWMYDTIKEFVH